MNASRENSEGEIKASAPEIAVQRSDGETTTSARLPNPGNAMSSWIIAVIAIVAALYLARAFFVPLLFGIIVSYTLGPVVDWLERYRIPRAVGAALVLAALIGGGAWMTLSLSGDTSAILEKLPDAARKLRQNVDSFSTHGPPALKQVQEAADELQGVAVDAGLKSSKKPVVVIRQPETSTWLRDFMIAQSALLLSFAAQAPVVVLLTYFVLAAGTHFRRKLVQLVGPSLTRKKEAVRILEEVDDQIQRYLLVMLVSNALVAVLTWIAFEMLGLEYAGVWGVAAGIFHFIPYLGTVAIAFGSGISGLLQFGSLTLAFTVAGVSVLASGLVGMIFTTWLQGRVARVNAAVLFIVLLFFGWLWGIAGLLLGAPLLAIAKVICDRVESLKPIGELLGR